MSSFIDSELLNSMELSISKEENRSISFTNKKAAYYFTQSHVTNHMEYKWFEGMNIAKQRIFRGYNLFADKKELNNMNSEVYAYPHKLIRNHPNHLQEQLWMFDYKNVIEVTLTGAEMTVGIHLKEVTINQFNQDLNIVFFKSLEGDKLIGLSSIGNQAVQVSDLSVTTEASAKGFLIAVGDTEHEVSMLIREVRQNRKIFKNNRITRLEQFLTNHAFINSDQASFNLAMQWIHLNMNQLVTNQQGEGIYAGLPWFNEYWGRDQFIALPGATLVSGQFETARNILVSFAKYQNKDEKSKYFGRVPNILGTEQINYHTTDATPRFNIQLLDYVKYTGDTSIINELYEEIKNSIEGSITYWVDENGYLLHDDNETWMDARDANLESYSPRDTRANDIQSLWYHQLRAGIYFATHTNDDKSVTKWNQIAHKLLQNFNNDFTDHSRDCLVDRLTKDDVQDFSLRPNQLFALDMIDDLDYKHKVVIKAWEELVYPWGVATLNRQHPFFHPFHLTSPDYHKDEAYHNGTIWPWLNGIAMQRMIEIEEKEVAFRLFKKTNWQALHLGVAGGLGENLDAYPHNGEMWPTLTGAYLQAWSNAEHLRCWYQYFLGLRPNLIDQKLIVAPRIPEELSTLTYKVLVGNGEIDAKYTKSKTNKVYRYTFNNISLNVEFDLYPFDNQVIKIDANQTLEINETESSLLINILDENQSIIETIKTYRIESNGKARTKLNQTIEFATPLDLKNHRVVKTK